MNAEMATRKPMMQPSPFQLALALAIVKAKPVDITVRDYITKIRQHLVSGSVIKDYGSRDKYLDAAGHWYSMYQDSQREIDHLQTSNAELEREKCRLEAELAKVRTGDVGKGVKEPVRPATAQPKGSTKRKKQSGKDDERLQHKKLKTGLELQNVANAAVVDGVVGVEETTGLDATITRHLYCIHKLYRNVLPDPAILAHHLVHATRAIASYVVKAAADLQGELHQASLAKDKRTRTQQTSAVISKLNDEFKDSQRAVVRSFTSLLHGLETLWKQGTESSKRNHGVATYEMICAFDALLSGIESTCHTQAKTLAADDNGATNEIRKKDQKSKRMERVLVPSEVTTLLLALLSGFSPSCNGPHTALFEGFLYVLLDRTAKKLFLLTFKCPQSASIEEDIELGDVNNNNHVDEITLRAANLEVQFLVQITERAMSIAPAFLGSLNASTATKTTKAAQFSTGSRSCTKSSNTRKSGLSITAKEKIQHTLVRCMFGKFPRRVHEGESDTEDEYGAASEFVDVLRKPVQIGPVPPPPRVDDADIPQWFREEMWRLIGWEILGREDGW